MKTKDILRKLMGDMSEGLLSRETGVPQTTIHRILTGQISESKPSTLRPLAEYFGVTIAQLSGEEASKNNPVISPKELKKILFENKKQEKILLELIALFVAGDLKFKDERLPISFLWWMQSRLDNKNA